jgi:hypothetical protein
MVASFRYVTKLFLCWDLVLCLGLEDFLQSNFVQMKVTWLQAFDMSRSYSCVGTCSMFRP